jgi:hypothetical protein
VPRPPGPLRACPSLFTPRAETLPARITGRRRPRGQPPPWGLVPLVPPRAAGAGPRVAGQGEARAAPTRP